MTITETDARLARRQGLTVGLLVVGYSGYYLCRSNLSVALPYIAEELAARGIDARAARVGLGTAASVGTLAYALGKFAWGGLADFLGGRRNFLAGMAGAVVCTLLFAAGGSLPVFTLAWSGNRFAQAAGWPGMMKLASRWFPHASYGRVAGVLSLSFLFGDAVARAFLGWLFARGFGWRGAFAASAGVLVALMVLCAQFLRESPAQLGLPEPETGPGNVFGDGGSEPVPPGWFALLGPLLRSRAVWIACALSLGLTLLRETFNTWTPTYFVEALGLSKPDAARQSAWFPFVGGVSVLLAAYLGDRTGRVGRAAILLVGLVLAGAVLLAIGRIDFGGSKARPMILVAAAAFLLIGPYSFLAGAVALDFGGKRGAATASALIDGVGYLGGVLAGRSVAQLSEALGWGGAFTVLAAVAWLSGLAALVFIVDQVRGEAGRDEALG